MFNSWNDYFIDEVDMALEDWAREMSKTFEAKLSDLIKDKFYLKDMGLALAYSVYNDNQSLFCEDHWIGHDHALCYLYRFSDDFKEEVKRAYSEYLENS